MDFRHPPFLISYFVGKVNPSNSVFKLSFFVFSIAANLMTPSEIKKEPENIQTLWCVGIVCKIVGFSMLLRG